MLPPNSHTASYLRTNCFLGLGVGTVVVRGMACMRLSMRTTALEEIKSDGFNGFARGFPTNGDVSKKFPVFLLSKLSVKAFAA